jgi:hypothetical protein
MGGRSLVREASGRFAGGLPVGRHFEVTLVMTGSGPFWLSPLLRSHYGAAIRLLGKADTCSQSLPLPFRAVLTNVPLCCFPLESRI